MLHYKLLVFSYFCLCSAWTASIENVTDEFSSKELDKSIPLTSEEVTGKVNWLPICQEVQINDLESNVGTAESNVVYVPQEVPGVVISPARKTVNSDDICEAPNGLGLKNLLKQSMAIIPYDRLKTIIVRSAKDLEVKRLKDLLISDNFRSKVRDLIESSHFIILRDYICRALNLDVKYFVKFVRSLIAVEKIQEPSETHTDCKGRAGIRGLIQELTEALPKQQLHDLYVRLLLSDEHLFAAVRQMRSNEFRQLMRNLTTVKEYQELKKMLVEVGVPLQGVNQLIDTALGWQSDELKLENFEKI